MELNKLNKGKFDRLLEEALFEKMFRECRQISSFKYNHSLNDPRIAAIRNKYKKIFKELSLKYE